MYLKLTLLGLLLICSSVIGQTTLTGDIIGHTDSIIADSPGEEAGDQDMYIGPNSTEQTQWRQIVAYMLDADYSSAHTLAGSLDYRIVEFTDTTASTDRVFYVLERTPSSTSNYWGTFIFNPGPRRPDLVIQAPHPLQNRNTGNQAVRVFTVADAWIYCLAGTHKCNATTSSGCAGTSTSCSETPEPYRICDQAHASAATFQLTTDEIMDVSTSAIFIQPHGYTKGSGGVDDPDIIMSNGTPLTPPVDHLSTLKANLLNQDNSLTFKIAHIDTDYTYFLGQTNLQGRLVNESADPCNTASTTNTGRFIHLEQAYSKLRDTEANWYKLADAVALTFEADGEIVTAQSGGWAETTTWVGGELPTEFDDVLISAGHTITVDDTTPECLSITFGDTAAHIDMNADSRLTVYGDFTLFSEDHNIFSAGWSSSSAYIRLAGSQDATLSGWSTSGGSSSFRDLIIEKDPGATVSTGGNGMRFAVQNSMEIISGTFLLGEDDDFEARWAGSGNLTGNQNLQITVLADGEFTFANGSGTHWLRSQTGSTPIGKLTIYGQAAFYDASSSDISINDIDVKDGGTLEIGTGLGSSSYGPEFNPGTITVDSGGTIHSVTTSDVWFDTTIVVLDLGGVYKAASSSTVLPPTFTNNGKVRYQYNPSTTADQTVVDTNYYDVEFSFDGGDHHKLWDLTASRQIDDSLTVNNSADLILSAASAQTVTIGNTLRLTSGSLDNSDADVTLELADGSLVSRATGTIESAPSFAGSVDVRYTSSSTSVTTGPELPTASSVLNDLTVYSSGQTVTLGADAVVNGALTISVGTFDNDGSEDDYTMTMADGSSIRRATADLTTAPDFAGVVDVEYISNASSVVTGVELPTGTSVLDDLTITGDEGVTLGADVTVNGVLTVSGSDLSTDLYSVTLADGASIVEDPSYTVTGSVLATRTISQSIAEDYGGLGVEITAADAEPGVTSVERVTGDPQSIDGVLGISRFFDISPATNTGLGATLVFHYNDTELDGIQEDSLALYSSTDAGLNWVYRGGVLDTEQNTVTLAGIGSFSRWTLGGVVLDGQAISTQSGSWTDPTTWLGGTVPTFDDDVLIVSGHTVSVDDLLAECRSLSFGGDDALIDMNAKGILSIHGDMTLFSESHNAFSAGWSSDSAFVRFAGGDTQTLSGWSTTGSSTSFRDAIIEKDSGSVIQTSGAGMRLCFQNSLEIISGILNLEPDDDIEARWTSSGNSTNNQALEITVHANGELMMINGDGTHFLRSGTGSSPVGPMTVYGTVEFVDASSYDISVNGITVGAGGQVNISTGLGSSTYGPEFNPGTITIDSGGVLYCETTSDVWFDTSVVILNRGGIYKTTSATTVLPPTFVNDGRVRYQRNPSTATTDQQVVDTNYYDLEFSFAGNDTKKTWTLAGDRNVSDSLEVNNSAELVLTAASAQTLTIDSTLRLTSGLLDNSDANVTIELGDGSLISRATGAITSAPSFAGVADVRYTSSVQSVATGPELPTGASALRDLTIYSSDQTVTLSADATVNGNLTLSMGTFDNNGSADDRVLSLSDATTIRRATGALSTAPVFGSMVDVEYISTVDSVVTGPELPAATTVLRDLRVLGNMGVYLGADATVNGELHLADSLLWTNGHTITLSSVATIAEDSIWVVQGRIETSRTLSQSVSAAFGGLGLELIAAGAAPGLTSVARVTGTSYSAGDAGSIDRLYEVSSAVNTGLDATAVVSYALAELNGLAAVDLVAYRSTNGGSSWESLGGVVDTLAQTVTVTGLDELGWITLAGPTSGCCGIFSDGTWPTGLTGNTNCSADGKRTLSDITKLIDNVYISKEPLCCVASGNTNGSLDCKLTLSDITKLIDAVYISKQVTEACMSSCEE